MIQGTQILSILTNRSSGSFGSARKLWGCPFTCTSWSPLVRPGRSMRGIVSSRGPSGAGRGSRYARSPNHRRWRFRCFPKSDPHLRPSGGISSLSSGPSGRRICHGLQIQETEEIVFAVYQRKRPHSRPSGKYSRSPGVPSARWERIGFSLRPTIPG